MATKEEIAAFLAAEFPQTKCVIQEVSDGGADRLPRNRTERIAAREARSPGRCS